MLITCTATVMIFLKVSLKPTASSESYLGMASIWNA